MSNKVFNDQQVKRRQSHINQRPYETNSKNEYSIQEIKEYSHMDDEKSYKITGKYLTQLPDYVLKQKDQLTSLNISNNHFFIFPTQLMYTKLIIFRQFKALITLDLSNNSINVIPKDFTKLTNLKILNLSQNNIQDLPENFQQLKNLEDLDISLNKISWFSSEITGLHISSLNIAQNSFSILPYKFGEFSKQLENFTLNWFKFMIPQQQSSQQFFNISILGLKFQNLFQNKQGVTFHQFVTILSNETQHDKLVFLYQAIDDEEEGIILDICQREQSVLTQINNSMNPLMYAFKNSNKSFKSMIQFYYYKEPLIILMSFLSIQKKEFNLIEELIKFGVDPNNQWNENLKRLSNNLNLSIKVENGDTLFHVLFRKACVQSGDYNIQQKIAEYLLMQGANPNIKNCNKFTPLHLIIQIPQIRSLKWAINYNTKVAKKFDFDKTGGASKWTLCHYTANQGYLKLLHELSYTEVDIFRRSLQNQFPKACCKSSLSVIKYIRKMEKNQLQNHFSTKMQQIGIIGTKIKEFHHRISSSINTRQINFEASFIDSHIDDDDMITDQGLIPMDLDQVSISYNESFFSPKKYQQQCDSIHSQITQISQNFKGSFNEHSSNKLFNIIGQITQPLSECLFVMALIKLIEFKLCNDISFKCDLIPTLLIHINQVNLRVQESMSIRYYEKLCLSTHEKIKGYRNIVTPMILKGSTRMMEEESTNQNVIQLRKKLQKNVQYDLANDWNNDDSNNYYNDIMILTESRSGVQVNFCSSRTTLLQYEQLQSKISRNKLLQHNTIINQRSLKFKNLSVNKVYFPQKKRF